MFAPPFVMILRDVMSTHVLTLQPFERAADALARMRVEGCRHGIVVREGKVVGVVSASDLGHPKIGLSRAGYVVGELMSRDPITGVPEMDVSAAARAMRTNSVGCLPILEGERIAGIVTVFDLLRFVEDDGAHAASSV